MSQRKQSGERNRPSPVIVFIGSVLPARGTTVDAAGGLLHALLPELSGKERILEKNR